MLGNDTDADGDPLSAAVVSGLAPAPHRRSTLRAGTGSTTAGSLPEWHVNDPRGLNRASSRHTPTGTGPITAGLDLTGDLTPQLPLIPGASSSPIRAWWRDRPLRRLVGRGGQSASLLARFRSVCCRIIWDHHLMELRPGLEVSDSALTAFARRYGVASMALFGSVLRADFDETSDVDILVEFKPDRTPGLFTLSAMERELESVLSRRVDLRTYPDLSRYFRDDVVASARVIYAA